MRKLILVLALGLCCQITFAQNNVFYFDANWKMTTEKNAVYFSVFTKAGTKYLRKDYFAKSKQLQMAGTYTTLKLDVKDGYFKWYYENGKPKEEGSYKNNKEQGEHIYYDENGTVNTRANFVTGELIGLFSMYFDSGKLRASMLYKKDERYHYTIYYREDGSKESEGMMGEPGKDGIWKYYDKNNQVTKTDTIKMEYQFAAAHMYMELPGEAWFLSNKAEAEKENFYVFKRKMITDMQGKGIVPAIVLKYGDAKQYKGDIELYTKDRFAFYAKADAKIDQQMIAGDKDCPLKYKNARLIKASYTQNGIEHILYIVYALTNDGTGIQIGMDMTKSITKGFEREFISVIKSIKQLN